jgi:hypothetical protein
MDARRLDRIMEPGLTAQYSRRAAHMSTAVAHQCVALNVKGSRRMVIRRREREHTSGPHHVRTSGPDHVRTFDVHTAPLLMNVNFFHYKEKVKRVFQKKKRK